MAKTINQELAKTEITILGKVIGHVSQMDQVDSFAVVLYDYTPNACGRQFVPDFPAGDLGIDFLRGVTEIYDAEGEETAIRADWSVFNTGNAP